MQCPMCKGPAQIESAWDRISRFWVQCAGGRLCGMRGPERDSREEAERFIRVPNDGGSEEVEQSMSTPYRKSITWKFDANGETWALSAVSATGATIEETRKEDCHFYGEVGLVGGVAILDDDAKNHIARYFNHGTAAAIEAYISSHGLPDGGPEEVV